MYTHIKAIIFDMDGVLIDAKDWHYESLNQALERHGILPISREDHLTKYDGLPTKEKIRIYDKTKNLDDNQQESINSVKQDIFIEIIVKNCIPYQIHQNALSQFKSEGYRLAVCSNAIRNSVEIMLSQADIMRYLDFYLSNQDVVHPKPNPEIYVSAIKKLGLLPSNVLICEDNIKGIQAAKESGAYVLEIGTIQDVTYENIKSTIEKIEKGEVGQICRPPIRTARLSEMSGGWFVGDFFPNILNTKDFEVAVKHYRAGDYEKWHVHKVGTEITVLIEGEAEMTGKRLKKGDIILLEPGHGTDFKALSDVKTVVVKTPSARGDKYFKDEFKKIYF